MAYHHGNLRQALLEAALELLGQRGPAGFTLREVARLAGVSHNAPYRHFQSRDEMLSSLATQGFNTLTRRMNDRCESSENTLFECGLAYIEFALDQPQYFSAMFDLTLDKESYPEYASARQRAFNVLMEAVRCSQRVKKCPSGDPESLAIRAWSLVHGLSRLAVGGCLPFQAKSEVMAYAQKMLRGDF